MASFVGSIKAVIGAETTDYKKAMQEVASITASTMDNVANKMSNSTNSTVAHVGQIMSQLSKNMPTTLSGVAPAMTAIFSKAGGQIQRVIASIGEKIPQPLKSAFDQINSVAQIAYSKISSGFSTALNSVSRLANGLGATVSSGFDKIASVANFTATKVPAPFKQAFQTIGYTASTLGGLTNKGFLGIASAAQVASNKIPSSFKTAFANVVSSASSMAGKITTPLNAVVSTTGNLATQVGSKMTTAFNNAGARAANALNGIGTNTDKASSKTASLIKQVGGVAAAYAGFSVAKKGISDIVSKSADFEQKMSNIKAVTGESSSTMKQFNDAAIKAGAETAYSASEAADAIGELSKAGVSTKDILNGGLTGALNLATAGELDLKSAAEIASTALNAFKKDNISVTDAANQLAGAANASATDVGELKFGLSMVSAVASGVGLSFKDTTDALAVFAQNGLKGSDAGTSLKTMLQNLQPAGKPAREMMEELGLVTADGANQFFDAEGKAKSFADISQLLKDKLSGLTQQQQQAALKTMFGSDAVRAATIAMNEGADGANNMQAAISKVTAADVAKEKLNNLKGAAEGLSGSFETLQIKVGTALLPLLTTVVKAVDKLVDSLGKSQGLDNFINVMSQLNPILDHFVNGTELAGNELISYRKAVMDVTTAIQPLLPLLSVLGAGLALDLALPAVVALSSQFTAFSGVLMSLASGPFQMVSSAISGLIGLIPNIGGSLAAASTVGMGALGGMTTAMATIMQVALAAIGPAAILGLVIAGLGIINTQFGDKINQLLQTVTTKGPQIITNLVSGITSQLPQLMASGTDLIAKFASAIATMIPVIIQAGIQIIGSLVQGVGQNAPSLINSALQVVTSFVSSVASALPQLINIGMQLLLNLVNGVIQNIPQIVSSAQQILTSFVGSVTQNLPQIIQTGIQILLGLINGLTQALPQLLPVALQAILSLIEGLMANIPQLMQGAIQIVNGLSNFIIQNLPMLLNAAIQIIMAIVNGLIQNLPQIISAGIQIIMSLVATVIQMLPEISAAGRETIVSLAGAILKAIPKVLQGAWDGITKGFSNLWKSLTNNAKVIGSNIIVGLINGINSKLKDLWNSIQNVGQGISDTIRNVLGIHSPSRVMKWMGQMVGEGLGMGMEGTYGLVAKKAAEFSSIIGDQQYDTESLLTADTAFSSQHVAGYKTAADMDDDVRNSQLREEQIVIHNELVGDQIYTSVKRREAREKTKQEFFN